ncbi:MAG TPA: hypothetical protein PK213_00480 [Deltaproteobacteria bacterium]|nr:hypothetical protein [Deltaproteobacteria bacterium]
MDDLPLERYGELVRKYPFTSSYKYVSAEVRRFCDAILMSSNGHVLELYNKWLLVWLIEKAVSGGLAGLNVPGEIKTLYCMNFERIMREIEFSENEPGFYMHYEDRFLRELGVCSLRVIPAGAQKISLSPLPMVFLFREGVSQFISGMSFLLFDLKGFKRFYSMHTDSHDPYLISEFNADGWRRYLVRTAELLKLNPTVSGMFGRSWFIDPQLEKISPKVCYVRRLVFESGGRIFYAGPAVDGIQDAVYKSPTRKKLYDDGKYIPREYIGIWPRKKLIGWAEGQKALSG